MPATSASHSDRLLLIATQTANAAADLFSNAKVVLPAIMASVGAPVFFTALLVPIRESGALLPQIFVGAALHRFKRRKRLLALSFLAQAMLILAVIVLSINAPNAASENTLAIAILVSLGLMALSRSVSSLTYKEVLGKSIGSGSRGEITGTASTLAGLITVFAGLTFILLAFANHDTSAQTALLFLSLAVVGWSVSALLSIRVNEPAGGRADSSFQSHLSLGIRLLNQDANFRRFLLTRALLVSSGLSAPFLVVLAQTESTKNTLSGFFDLPSAAILGALMALSGFASLISGRVWGLFSDTNSQIVLTLTSVATATICCLAALLSQSSQPNNPAYLLLFFLLAVVHQGVRIARSTYVLDVASDETRSHMVAISNTLIGVWLLLIGAVIAAIAQLSITWALGFLALMAALAALVSLRLVRIR